MSHQLKYPIAVALALVGLALGCVPLLGPLSQRNEQGNEQGNERDSRFSVFTGRSGLAKESVVLVELREPALLERFPLRPASGRSGARGWKEHALLLAKEQDAYLSRLREVVPSVTLERRYTFAFNGLALRIPKDAMLLLGQLSGSAFLETAGAFARPRAVTSDVPANAARTARLSNGLPVRNPIAFVGAAKAHERGWRGAGIRIGIVDTGIDYTHVAFTGLFSEDFSRGGRDPAREAFAGNAPDVVEPGSFPTAKVVGGVDLVGTEFDALSPLPEVRRPRPDADPLDEGFHGTHVAALAAGVSVPGKGFAGGVAPEASLFAIKIFGREGGTSDEVILAALETAADPDGNGFADDALPIVNFSLGSRYGTPSNVHARAVRTLSRAGTLVVAAVGNDGSTPFVVGSPATVEDALAVAASVDDSDWNWRKRAVEVSFASGSSPVAVEAVEGETTFPLAQLADGPPLALVDLGAGNVVEFERVGASLAGKVALVDRGGLSFDEKIARTQAAGGLGILVSNGIDEEPFAMGGDASHTIPGIMVRGSFGQVLREELARGEVAIDFVSDRTLDTPEKIDTIAPFSSRGPRSLDGLLKPDLAGPGVNLLGPASGSGSEFIVTSGSSMASPLVAGAAALVQSFLGERGAVVKTRLMNSAQVLESERPTSTGAGRLSLESALGSRFLVEPASVSLGASAFTPEGAFVELTLTNLLSEGAGVSFEWPESAALEPIESLVSPVHVPAGTSRRVRFAVRAKTTSPPSASDDKPGASVSAWQEASAFLRVVDNAGRVAGVPLYAAALPSARVVAAPIVKNEGPREAQVLAFPRYVSDDISTQHGPCDLAGLGLRLREGRFLQAAFVLARAVSTFALCEPSLLLDTDSDGVTDFELTSARGDELSPGSYGGLPTAFSFLLDARRSQALRTAFDATWRMGQGRTPDFGDAIVDLQDVNDVAPGTLVLLQMDLARLPASRPFPNQDRFRFAALVAGTSEPAARPDDVLGADVAGLSWDTADLAGLALGSELSDLRLKPGERASWPNGLSPQFLLVPENESGRNVLRLR
ncbi:MAG: S8 family serine peptidase [Silvanigrellales bacterium]|nr:S8 family serine peptidase [Silvanigrellales bacterium]